MKGRLSLEARLARLRVQVEALNVCVRLDNARLRAEVKLLRAGVRGLLAVVERDGPDIETYNTD